jgi:hypothetical protein
MNKPSLNKNWKLASKPARKPRSVLGDHLSCLHIAVEVLCGLPEAQTLRAAACLCLALLPAGDAWPPGLHRMPVRSYRAVSPSPEPSPEG